MDDKVQQETMKFGEIEMFRKTHCTIKNEWTHRIAEDKYVCSTFKNYEFLPSKFCKTITLLFCCYCRRKW